jgi:hypothetical protein
MIAKAIDGMVIYHSRRLHEGVTDGRTDEFESPLD